MPYPIVPLVGYTNAGKSTLFNALTRAEELAKDQLFATLDPTMRGLTLPSGRTVILSDTVGFVSDLPHELVAAFRATLEEVLEADLIIHVRDIAHEDSAAQKADVEKVLAELGMGDAVAMIEALNKIDLAGAEQRLEIVNQAERHPESVPLSAVTGAGLDDLARLIDLRLVKDRQLLELAIPLSDGATIAWLYRKGEVIERQDDEQNARLLVRLDAPDAKRFEQRAALGEPQR